MRAQPPLEYVAPELVASGTTQITASADIFSLAAVSFELLVKRQLLPVAHRRAHERHPHTPPPRPHNPHNPPALACLLAQSVGL